MGLSVGSVQAQSSTSPLADKIVHVYNPFGRSLPLINLSGVGHAMQDEGGNWHRFEFASLGGGLQAWMVDFGIRTGDWRWLNRNGLGGEGVFGMEVFAAAREIWIIVDPADTASAPQILAQPPPRVRLFNPWPASGPQLVLGGRARPMQADKEHCGWYVAYLLGPAAARGHFRNPADLEALGRGGIGDTGSFDFTALTAALGRDLWIASAAEITGADPGKAGSCTYLMAATVRDMAQSHPDYGNTGGRGMVQAALGADRKPVPTPSAPPNFNTWFNTDPNRPMPLKGAETCLDLEMSRADDGLWEYDSESLPGSEGFFPIDDWNTLDSNRSCSGPVKHNYGFCLESHATFVYQKGQVFDFRGDDDVWVYIDGKLALDLGGIHPPMDGRIALDSLGLVEGRTYPWDFFFCERNMCGSSLRIKTTIYFKQQRALDHAEDTLPDGTRNIRVIKRIGGTGACGSSGDSLQEVPPGPLTFILYRVGGDSLQTLPRGRSFGGIEVGEGSVRVDTSKVTGLPAGQYRIVFFETAAPRLRDEVRFTVTARNLVEFEPPYAVTATLGETVKVVAANRFLDSLVAETAPWTPVFTSGLSVHGDSARTIPIRSGTAIATAPTGLDTLWVTGDPAAQADRTDTLSIPGSAKRVLVTFRLPPLDLPAAVAAAIFDADGDGRGDSLVVRYDRDIASALPAKAAWRWPADAPAADETALDRRLQGGRTLVFAGAPLSPGVLTAGRGVFESTYPARAGKDSVQRIPIEDSIGPVIIQATLLFGAGQDTLRLSFSEPLSAATLAVPAAALFGYRLAGDSAVLAIAPIAAAWTPDGASVALVFPSGAVPAPKSGDYVRLNDGPGLAADASGNRPGPQTRFRIIVGDRRVGIRTVSYREIAPDAALLAGPAFEASRHSSGATVNQIVESTGRMGFLLEMDLADFAAGDGLTVPEPGQVVLEYTVALFTNHGTPVASEKRTLACSDDLLFGGDCRARRGRIFIGWNYTSRSGQRAATGAYVAAIRYRVKVKAATEASGGLEQIWGILRRN